MNSLLLSLQKYAFWQYPAVAAATTSFSPLPVLLSSAPQPPPAAKKQKTTAAPAPPQQTALPTKWAETVPPPQPQHRPVPAAATYRPNPSTSKRRGSVNPYHAHDPTCGVATHGRVNPRLCDSLFWCFYMIHLTQSGGYADSVLAFQPPSFLAEKPIKIRYAERFEGFKEQMKALGLKPFTEIRGDLANMESRACIGIKTFFALCLMEDLNVMLVVEKDDVAAAAAAAAAATTTIVYELQRNADQPCFLVRWRPQQQRADTTNAQKPPPAVVMEGVVQWNATPETLEALRARGITPFTPVKTVPLPKPKRTKRKQTELDVAEEESRCRQWWL